MINCVAMKSLNDRVSEFITKKAKATNQIHFKEKENLIVLKSTIEEHSEGGD